MVTKSGLVFIGGGDKYLYAFDAKTGREVWRAPIPYANTATPMTYRTRDGRQFLVVATGTGAENRLVAFALGTVLGLRQLRSARGRAFVEAQLGGARLLLPTTVTERRVTVAGTE